VGLGYGESFDREKKKRCPWLDIDDESFTFEAESIADRKP
jgi:hypothetical protein